RRTLGRTEIAVRTINTAAGGHRGFDTRRAAFVSKPGCRRYSWRDNSCCRRYRDSARDSAQHVDSSDIARHGCQRADRNVPRCTSEPRQPPRRKPHVSTKPNVPCRNAADAVVAAAVAANDRDPASARLVVDATSQWPLRSERLQARFVL